jgi:hypothetical protein
MIKSLIYKLVLPLTIISFAAIVKWWYALPIDGPETLLYGFPFPFISEAWHTSMSIQIFLLELGVNFITFLSFWFLLVFSIHQFVIKIRTYKIVTIVLWVLSGFILLAATLIASSSNNLWYIKRPFNIEVMETGYKCIWQNTNRPNYPTYHPR